MKKWPKIYSFHNVYKSVRKTDHWPRVTYKAKIKLHGTNAGIYISNHVAFAQSRNQMLSTDNDNNGFAKWVEEVQDYFNHIFTPYTIYGEWCGKGINKGTAIHEVDEKQYAVFAAYDHTLDRYLYEPNDLSELLDILPDNCFIIPFEPEVYEVNFTDASKILPLINEKVEKISVEDPLVKDRFEVSGIGEGLVFFPTLINSYSKYLGWSDLLFKAKNPKFMENATKKKTPPVQLEPEVLNSINSFVAAFVTGNRVDQALEEAVSDEPDISHMGDYLKWIHKDILAESEAEREAANLDWGILAKYVTKEARTKLLERLCTYS